MKKTVFLLLACHLSYFTLLGQVPAPTTRHENLNFKKISRKVIELKPSKETLTFQNLQGIDVVDSRPDTTVIGLSLIAKHIPYFVLSQGSFSGDVKQFLDSSLHFTKHDSFSVVMVIKKFWLTSGLDQEMEQEIQNTEVDSTSKKISSLLVRIEFYLKKGSDLFVLYRFDTTITRNSYVSREGSVLMEQGLMGSLSKLKDIEPKFQSISETKRKFTWPEIEGHNQKQFDIPILKDSVPVRGVYFSFEEFKNNNPGQRDFEVDKDKLIDLIFIKEADGKTAAVRGAWGYSDGHNLYINSMDNYFLLQRQGNAFYTYGAKEFKHKKVAHDSDIDPGPNAAAEGTTHYNNKLQKTSKRHLSLELKPYELDWDDGQLN
jgi:hypothetical protein